jgi:peptide/nickel transport system substrate-binding protein
MTTRRDVLKGSAAAGALIAAPGLAKAQGAAPPANRTLRAVIHGDIGSFDPIWTTANVTSYHGGMVYDTLFSADAEQRPRPQMVGQHNLSEDRKTYTFVLRDGLRFSDGSPVTARDCVASVRRWAARDGFGQHMFQRVADTPVVDDKTFRIVLREPYALVLDALAKLGTNVCYVMREREAQTDPNTQVTEIVGSGPFTFNRDQFRQGVQYVYDKNPNYVPRNEPVSGSAGGKVVKLDRVVIANIRDEQTQVAALQAGEIDFIEHPSLDLLDTLQADRNLKLEVLNRTGNVGWCRLNFLHPPFDNVKARQAVLAAVDQREFMAATFNNPTYARTCGSLFGCGTPMENDANTEWFKRAPDLERARQLWREAGFTGTVTVLQATNIAFMNNSALLIAQTLRNIGANVELAASDWGGVVTRRSNKGPPSQGGWNVFITWGGGNTFGNPIALAGHAATGERGWFGWPADETHERLRNEWAAAPDEETRKAVARRLQENAWNFVPHVYLGQWTQPSAMRRNVNGVIGIPELVPFWNIEKTA